MKPSIFIRKAGIAIALLDVLSGITSSAATINVTSGNSIQAAVDRAASGDTIHLAAGVYQEQIFVLEKKLTLLGESGAILRAPAAMGTTLAPLTTRRAVLAILYSEVNVTGLAFEGNRSGATNARLTGIYYVASEGVVNSCSFYGFRSESRVPFRESAYVAANPVGPGPALTHVEVLNSVFRDNEDSMLLIGDEIAAEARSVLRQTFIVAGNTITGLGAGSNGYQFGVRITVGASGEVRDNVISGYLASGNVPSLGLVIASAGVMVFDNASIAGARPPVPTQAVFVERNTLTNNLGGVNLFSAAGSRVADNRIEGTGTATGFNEGGICISGTNITAINNQISNNPVGISLIASPIFGVATNTVLIGNVITGAVTPIKEQAGVTGTSQPMPPVIITQATDQAAPLAGSANFVSPSVTGTVPLSYQWQFEGVDLAGATNRSLGLRNVQFTNAGLYTLRISNSAGAITSGPVHLSVAEGKVYTNRSGALLPYRLFLPNNYDSSKQYPLVLFWHGGGETGTDNLAQLRDNGQFVFLSAANRVKYPCVFVAPQIPSPSAECKANLAVIDQGAELLHALISELSIDPDRIYVTGLSHGGYYTWIFPARYPELVAAAVPMSGGWLCHTNFLNIRAPVWNFHAADDRTVVVGNSDSAVRALRNAGGNPIYTRFTSGGHPIWKQSYNTPGLVDWVMAQRRGHLSTNSPFLKITMPTTDATFATSSAEIDLAGTASHDSNVLSVAWTNMANGAAGAALGTNRWAATNIPLRAGVTNLIVVTSTGTSYSPGLSTPGDTSFNETLRVVPVTSRPILLSLSFKAQNLGFTWDGEANKSYRVEYKNSLSDREWTGASTMPTINGSSASFAEPLGTNSQRFYRVVQLN
jgi:poly(3-hydroxybutyrate) depolymerase